MKSSVAGNTACSCTDMRLNDASLALRSVVNYSVVILGELTYKLKADRTYKFKKTVIILCTVFFVDDQEKISKPDFN